MQTGAKKQKEVKPVPMELTELKNGIKGIEQGIKRIEEVGKQVSELKEQTDTFLENNEVVNKDNYQEASRLVSLLRTTRTSLDSERKTGVAPLNNAVKYYNSLYNENIEDIKEAEAKIKPLKDVYDKEEEDRKEKAKQEKEKAFAEKIQALNELGAQLIDGWYVIKSPDGDEDKNISYQAAEIRSISDENWEKVKKLATQFKVEAQQRAEAEAKEAKEKEDKRLAEEAELRKKIADAENEKLSMRKEMLEMQGFKEEGEHFTFHSLKYSKAEIIAMDSDAFSGIKLKVAEISEKVKKEEEVEKRVTKLAALDFYRSGNEFIHTSNKFKYSIPVSTLENNEAFEKEIAEFENQQSAYLIKEQTENIRRKELNDLGFNMANNGGWFYDKDGYEQEMPNDILECEKEVFRSMVDLFNNGKHKHEKEQAKIIALKVERSNQLQQSGLKFDYQKDLFFYNYEMPGEVSGFEIKMSDVVNYSAEEFKSVLEANEKTIVSDKAAKIAYDKQQEEARKLREAEQKSDKENITAFFTMIKVEANKVVIKDESVRKKFLEELYSLADNTMHDIG